MQVLRVCAFCAFSAPPAFLPCSCSLAFRHQVRRLTSRISSESYPGSQECVANCHGAAEPSYQTWPRHPCHPWGLKTTGFEREIVAPPDRKPLIFQLYNNFWTSKYALKTRQA